MHPQPVIAFLDSLGGWEILMISAVILLLFGPKRLPEIARLIGRASATLQRAMHDFKDQLMQGAEDEPAPRQDPEGESPLPDDYAEQPHTPPAADSSGPPEGSDRPDPPRAG
jgi:TatA/E family protein of Tat protein translocase